MRKIFTWATAGLFFLTDLIDFFLNKVYTLLEQHFSLLKNKESYLLLFEEKKT